MPLPYELHLALRYLRFHRGRTFLSVITLISVVGVAVGTAALVIALALMTGFQEDVRERILGGSAHLTVMSAADTTFPDAEDLAARLESVPGVRAAGPVLFSPAMIVREGVDAPAYVELEGVDASRHGRVVSLQGGSGDPLAGLQGDPQETIVLGAELARKLAAAPGDRVRVVVPRLTLTPFAAIPRSRVFRVAGVFRSDAFQQDAQRAYVRIEDARKLLDAKGKASWIELRLDALRDLEERKRFLRSALGGPWIVVDLIEQNEAVLKALNTEKVMLFLAIGLIVIVAALNIVSTLILMVNDKVREIGTLSALGARRVGIASIFVLQGIVIGVTGTAAGLALGATASWWLDRYRVIPLNPDVYYLSSVPFATRPSDLVAVGVVSLVISAMATVYPAWRAASQDPVEAIRHE